MSRAVPTPRQAAFQDWEFGLFVHFGIRTFYEGHRDFDNKVMAASAFDPTDLDCGEWASTAREAGMRYAIMTVKHHDGFCLWPTHETDFCVRGAPWRGGKGDVVREFTSACRAHNLAVGLYYSPADWHNPDFTANPSAYDTFFLAQLRELLTGYGPIDILWFDGCGSDRHAYDWREISRTVRRLQPDLLIGIYGDPDYRWVGNEEGVAPLGCRSAIDAREAHGVAIPEKLAQGEGWFPAECDCRMRERNWFYSERDESTVKSVERLMGLYYYSVGRNANLLLNVGPDRRGHLPEADRRRLLEFGAEIRRRLGDPLAVLGDWRRTDSGWEYTPARPIAFDHAVVQEDLAGGERIRRFRLQVVAGSGDPITVWEGCGVGHKVIAHFPLVPCTKAFLRIDECDGDPLLRALSLHDSTRTRA